MALCSGCFSVETHHDPHVKVAQYQRFFVEHRLTDDRHIDDTIVAELRSLGRQASTGPLTMMPDDAQVVISYQDEWAWDFKNYLIQLNIQLREARTDRPLATGSYRQPSMVTKSPARVVKAVLEPLFKTKK
jgi:hypothetical protein